MVVADSPQLEPIPHFVVINLQDFVEIAGAEGRKVKYPVDKEGRVIGSAGDESHHDGALRWGLWI